MHTTTQETIYDFLHLVAINIQEGMPCHDAIDLSAVMIGGTIPSIVSQATSKYQEATNSRTELSQQTDVDALALLSMDVLWYADTHDGQSEVSLELADILAQSVYLLLKYYETNNTLEMNRKLSGGQEARASMIGVVLMGVH